MIRTIKSAMLIVLSIVMFTACDLTTDDDLNTDDTDPREKFYGVWTVNETCSKQIYSVEISEDFDNSSQVLIENFGNPGSGDPAVGVVLNNKITIDPGYEIGEGWTVSGTGEMVNSKKISWEYELLIAGTYYECTANFVK